MKRTRLMVAAGMALVLTAMTAKAENSFPFAVFEKMQQTVDGNIIVSPFSLEQAIGMVANGAKGTTQDELLALTGDSSLSALNARNQQMAALLTTYQSDTLSSMHVANSVWHVPAMNLMAPFRDSVLTRYNAYIDTANFATKQGIDTVNAWVCRHTDSLIEKILQEPDPSLLVTLINTTLFHGTWMWGYNPYEIGVRPFRNADGTGTNVEMIGISSQSTMVVYLDYDLVGIGLDFVGEDFGSHYHVMFILPRDYQNMVALTAERWHTLLNNRQYKYMYVQVPKFDVSCTEEMLGRLQEMGAFVGRDFSGIADGAFVSSVKHSTRMILNEKGMSAAAVTVIGMTSGMPDPIDYTDFIINRPFYVAIMADGTDEPVFLAKIKQLDGAACEAPAAPYLTLGVDNRKASATPTKILRDGHIYISTPIGTFNATGKLVE
ncbi:MAG: hypothetical protein IKN59_06340 [Paludibacteraceae bacterium]|nr:hypothetical protein [Paludibacteraceae bacterium]